MYKLKGNISVKCAITLINTALAKDENDLDNMHLFVKLGDRLLFICSAIIGFVIIFTDLKSAGEKMMVKYEIILNWAIFGYSERNKIEQGCTLGRLAAEPMIAESFDYEDEALRAFEKYETIIKTAGSAKNTVFDITEYYLQRSVYEPDMGYAECEKIYGFSPIIIRLIESGTERVVRTMGSYAKAAEIKRTMERENKDKRYYLSYNY